MQNRARRVSWAGAFLLLWATGAVAQSSADRLLVNAETATALGYRIQWQKNLPLPGRACLEEITPEQDMLLLTESGNVITAMDPASGAVLWRSQAYSLNEKLSKPLRYGNSVLVSTPSRTFLLSTANGNLQRFVPLVYAGDTDPVVVEGRMVFGSHTGVVFCQSVETGQLLWAYRQNDFVHVAPEVREGVVYSADVLGSVAALDLESGNLIWRRVAPPWKRSAASPLVGDVAVYIASQDQALYGFDRFNAAEAPYWRYLASVPLVEGPTLIDRRLYQPIQGAGLVCIDALNGEEIWQATEVEGQLLTLNGNRLLVWNKGEIIVVDAENGSVLARHAMPRPDRVVADKILNGSLYLLTDGGAVLKLALLR
jgi:outer membrane protein assembly factor BamB